MKWPNFLLNFLEKRTLQKWVEFDSQNRSLEALKTEQSRQRCYEACRRYLQGEGQIDFNYGKPF